mmetsp:Transcript_35759/g.83404  ORF Transcript_35759/g.83404 Transcript_35759/m.83404 type:complete len:267 (-) Transcript_35759:558-1358(-)
MMSCILSMCTKEDQSHIVAVMLLEMTPPFLGTLDDSARGHLQRITCCDGTKHQVTHFIGAEAIPNAITGNQNVSVRVVIGTPAKNLRLCNDSVILHAEITQGPRHAKAWKVFPLNEETLLDKSILVNFPLDFNTKSLQPRAFRLHRRLVICGLQDGSLTRNHQHSPRISQICSPDLLMPRMLQHADSSASAHLQLQILLNRLSDQVHLNLLESMIQGCFNSILLEHCATSLCGFQQIRKGARGPGCRPMASVTMAIEKAIDVPARR